MAEILGECEKELQDQLDKLDSFRAALRTALEAIQNVHEQSQSLSLAGSAEDMVQRILSRVLNRTTTAPDIIADSRQAAAVQNNDTNKVTMPNVVEVAAEVDETPAEPTVVEISSASKVEDLGSEDDELVQHLLRVGGAKKGVKYKIEVTSPLGLDGTFWACHVESGFIQNKLEPLSDRLRSATQRDRSLWKVTEPNNKMLCVKSIDNGLWMRAIYVKNINDQVIKVRFIDVGRTEDVQINRLSLVPQNLAEIPFMAFNCAIFDHPVSLGYDAKWKFSDLTKKKILNFTVENLLDRDGLTFLMGKIETILDDPMVNVTEEIRKFDKTGIVGNSSKEDNGIVSRDIRTIDASNADNFTSINEVIQKSDEIVTTKNVSFEESPLLNKTVTKNPPNLSPIIIPSSPPQPEFDWGDTKTPGADDAELELAPLDENIFEMSMSHDEKTNEDLKSGAMNNELNNFSSTKTKYKQEPSFSFHSSPPANEKTVIKLQEQLFMLLQQQRSLLLNPQISQENPDAINVLQQKIAYIQNDLNSLISQQPAPTYMQQMQQQQSQFAASTPPVRSPQMPIGTRPPGLQANVQMQGMTNSYFSDSIKNSTDYDTKIQQLDAITRCLRMPSDCLNDSQMQELQATKLFLEKQLREEEQRMKQMGRTLLMQNPVGTLEDSGRDVNPQMRQFSPPEHQVLSDYFNPRFGEPPAGIKPDQMQHLFHKQNNMQVNTSESLLYGQDSTQYSHGHVSRNMPEILSRQHAQDVSQRYLDSSEEVNTQFAEKASKMPDPNHIVEPKRFEIVPYDKLFTESRNDWAARELVNLTHPYLEHPKARFYTVICLETKPGNFIPNLKRTYVNGYYWLHDPDAEIFRKEWETNDGPLFLIVKHRPLKGNVVWKCGGICQVLSKVREIPNITVRQNNMSMQCQVRFVSTSLFDDVDCLRSDKTTREIPTEIARKVIKHFIQAVQDGSGENMFHYFQKCAQAQYHKSADYSSYHASGRNTPPGYQSPPVQDIFVDQKHMLPNPEDWDQDIGQYRKSVTSEDFGSGDEGERDINAEIEAFGLSADDLS